MSPLKKSSSSASSPSKRTSKTKGVRDRALLLRRYRYGESSLLVHALSEHHGRVALLAKGAYRLRSGFFGVLDLFDTLELEWKPPKETENQKGANRGDMQASGERLGTLSKARILVRRRALSQNLARYRSASTMLELARLGSMEEGPERELFQSLDSALDGLCHPRSDPLVAQLSFDLAFLSRMGIAPALGHCASCGRSSHGGNLRPKAHFSHLRGGLLCSACSETGVSSQQRVHGDRVETLPWEWVRAAQALSDRAESQDPKDPALLQKDTPKEIQTALARLITTYLEHHLERRFKSRPKWSRPRRKAP